MATAQLFIGNDNRLLLTGLQNKASGSYINDATPTVTLVDKDGADVSGAVGVALGYIASSSGNYAGTLPDTLSLTEYAHYTAKVTADAGAGLKGYWELAVQAVRRTG